MRVIFLFLKVKPSMNNDNDYEIEYLDNNGTKTKRTISPIRSFSYNSKRYVEAYCHLRKENRSFKINSIMSMKPVGKISGKYAPSFSEVNWGKKWERNSGIRKRTKTNYLEDKIKDLETSIITIGRRIYHSDSHSV